MRERRQQIERPSCRRQIHLCLERADEAFPFSLRHCRLALRHQFHAGGEVGIPDIEPVVLLKKTEASLCHQNPGFPDCVRGPLAALVAWWRGDISFVEAQRIGLAIEGPKAFTRAFPKWFDLYPFAHIGPAVGAAGRRLARTVTTTGVS
jgi:hypothetical protein